MAYGKNIIQLMDRKERDDTEWKIMLSENVFEIK